MMMMMKKIVEYDNTKITNRSTKISLEKFKKVEI